MCIFHPPIIGSDNFSEQKPKGLDETFCSSGMRFSNSSRVVMCVRNIGTSSSSSTGTVNSAVQADCRRKSIANGNTLELFRHLNFINGARPLEFLFTYK